MDYLGHAIVESSTPTPPEPSEPDPHFKVIYRQNKVGLVKEMSGTAFPKDKLFI